ncbi:MAG: DUF202 domain-containing protein [Trebonia sp.]
MTGPADPSSPADPAGPADPSSPAGPGRAADDQEERDAGLARERTSLAWTRTAISFGAVGGAVLKANVITGLIILAMAPVVWQLGRVSRGGASQSGARGAGLPVLSAARLFLITVSIIVVALICLALAIFGKSAPGALR